MFPLITTSVAFTNFSKSYIFIKDQLYCRLKYQISTCFQYRAKSDFKQKSISFTPVQS